MEHFYTLIVTYKYLVLFFAATLEGPAVAVFAGVLIKINQLDLAPTCITLILGNILPDIFYYSIGYFGQKNIYIQKIINKFSFIENNFKLIKKLWSEHFKKTVFFSKLAYGISTPFLISAGLVKVPFWRFISRTIAVDLSSIFIFVFLGMIFSKASYIISGYANYFAIFISLFFILFIIIFHYISKKAAQEIIKLED